MQDDEAPKEEVTGALCERPRGERQELAVEQDETKAPKSFFVPPGCHLIIGALAMLGLFALFGGLYLRHHWHSLGDGQWKSDGDAIMSPSERYAVTPLVVIHPKLEFGLLLSDHQTGREDLIGGWTRCHPLINKIRWISDDRVRIEHYDQWSLNWEKKAEQLFGVRIDWVCVSRSRR